MAKCIFCHERDVMQDRAACAACYRDRLRSLLGRLLSRQPPPAWLVRAAQENAEFENAMIGLASLVYPSDLECITEAFKKWAPTVPLSWRDAVSYCHQYHAEQGRFPFELRDALDEEIVLVDILDAEVIGG